jgi:hypothetical protein
MVIRMKQKSTGSKHTGSAAVTGRSRVRSTRDGHRYPYLAICVQNKGNEASLEIGKAYRIIKPQRDDPGHRVRVIDEEGEDYLYLAEWFIPIEVPNRTQRRVLEAALG